MSRASDVRDALVADLQAELGASQPVEAFIIPRFKREELVSGPRVVVRVGGREISMLQGPDETDVSIEVGVVGITPDGSTALDGYGAKEIELIDTYDALMESIIALWMHGGAFSRGGIAGHYPVGITQVIQFDAEKLYSDGVYLSLIQITYRDSED